MSLISIYVNKINLCLKYKKYIKGGLIYLSSCHCILIYIIIRIQKIINGNQNKQDKNSKITFYLMESFYNNLVNIVLSNQGVGFSVLLFVLNPMYLSKPILRLCRFPLFALFVIWSYLRSAKDVFL